MLNEHTIIGFSMVFTRLNPSCAHKYYCFTKLYLYMRTITIMILNLCIYCCFHRDLSEDAEKNYKSHQKIKENG